MGRAKPEVGQRAIVVFGASGSLARKRILPAIEKLASEGTVSPSLFAIGVDLKAPPRARSKERFAHIQGDLIRRETYGNLSAALRAKLPGPKADCTYYLAVGPQLFLSVVKGLEESGLAQIPASRRILVEKPFGTGLGSCRKLQRQLDLAFGRARVYRVDHFLAKTGVREIMRTRLASAELEEALNRDCVDHVQLIADERQGVEGRVGFYDKVGVMRDMVQNHMLQMLCQVAMEPPRSDDSEQQDEARADLMKRLGPIGAADIVWGQYSGYRFTEGVGRGSRTPTFVALRVSVENKRWSGVPFYIRTGRRLRRNVTKVVVVFRRPVDLKIEGRMHRLEFVSFGIDPAQAVAGGLIRNGGVGDPGACAIKGVRSAAPQDEYELLLHSAFDDDHSLFVGDGFNERAWKLVDPPIRQLEEGRSNLRAYTAGTDGPAESEELLRAPGQAWL